MDHVLELLGCHLKGGEFISVYCHVVLQSRSLKRRGFVATLLSAGALGFLECSIFSRGGEAAVL